MPRVAPPLQLSEDEVIALRNYSSTEHAQIVAELEHMKLENTKEPPLYEKFRHVGSKENLHIHFKNLLLNLE